MQEWVVQAIREASYEVARNGDKADFEYEAFSTTRRLAPWAVHQQLEKTRPDVIAHIRRYRKDDPYRVIKPCIPEVS